jgi:hypothetical protein
MATIAERLEQYSIPEPNSGCLLWTGCCNDRGYGHLANKGKVIAAHRLSWIEAYGPIPTGMWVLHKCDLPWCIEPTHLFLGTAKDNSDDKIAKGRMNRRDGEHNGRAKLTVEDVKAILVDPRRHRVIAADYGVTRPMVSYIKRREFWKDVEVSRVGD